MAYFLAVFWGLGSSSCTRLGTLFSSFLTSLAFAGHPIRLATACAAASRAPFDLASSRRTRSRTHPCSPTSRFMSMLPETLQMVAAAACWAPTEPSRSTCARRGSTQSDTRLSGGTTVTRFRSAATGGSCGSGPSRHSAAYSLEPRTTPESRMLIMTRTTPSSASACRTSGTAEMFLSAPDAADCVIESPVWHMSMRARKPLWPTIARAMSADMDSRCSVMTAFSRPTRLPDSASRMSGGSAPSDTSKPSQLPDSASKHKTVAAFSLTLGVVAVSSCTSAATLPRPSADSTLFSSSRRASSRPSTARCFASACPICSLASSSRTSTCAPAADAVSAGAAGTVASDNTPVLTRREQSLRLRSSFPASASRSLCICSFPAFGGSWQRAPSSAASASVAATDCNSSRQSEFLEKQGWLDRSDRHCGSLPSLAAIAFHRPPKPVAARAAARAGGTSPRARSSSSSAVAPPATAGQLPKLISWQLGHQKLVNLKCSLLRI
uniref:Uncharacterized protein n=1 Tax=Zea mays TaxID=4577 RepID=A0A804LMG0_MAIZE